MPAAQWLGLTGLWGNEDFMGFIYNLCAQMCTEMAMVPFLFYGIYLGPVCTDVYRDGNSTISILWDSSRTCVHRCLRRWKRYHFYWRLGLLQLENLHLCWRWVLGKSSSWRLFSFGMFLSIDILLMKRSHMIQAGSCFTDVTKSFVWIKTEQGFRINFLGSQRWTKLLRSLFSEFTSKWPTTIWVFRKTEFEYYYYYYF